MGMMYDGYPMVSPTFTRMGGPVTTSQPPAWDVGATPPVLHPPPSTHAQRRRPTPRRPACHRPKTWGVLQAFFV